MISKAFLFGVREVLKARRNVISQLQTVVYAIMQKNKMERLMHALTAETSSSFDAVGTGLPPGCIDIMRRIMTSLKTIWPENWEAMAALVECLTRKADAHEQFLQLQDMLIDHLSDLESTNSLSSSEISRLQGTVDQMLKDILDIRDRLTKQVCEQAAQSSTPEEPLPCKTATASGRTNRVASKDRKASNQHTARREPGAARVKLNAMRALGRKNLKDSDESSMQSPATQKNCNRNAKTRNELQSDPEADQREGHCGLEDEEQRQLLFW